MSASNDTPLNMFPNPETSAPPAPSELGEPEPFTFTMTDVCEELEALRKQIEQPTESSDATEVARMRRKKKKSKKGTTNVKTGKSESIILSGPWSFFNRDIDFITFSRAMKKIDESRLISLATTDLGNRISYHKEKSDENGDPIHVYYKGKLNELKSSLDVSKALVLLFVFRRMPSEKIEALERKLFPLPAKVLVNAAKVR